MSEFHEAVLNKISEVSERTIEIKAKQELMEKSIEEIKLQDVRQNELLAEHIAGVQTAQARLDVEIKAREDALRRHEDDSEERYKDLSKRLEIVEFLPNLLKGLWKVAKWVAGAAAAIMTITKFLGHW